MFGKGLVDCTCRRSRCVERKKTPYTNGEGKERDLMLYAYTYLRRTTIVVATSRSQGRFIA